MYTAFYGLREKPFSLTPNPAFLYLSDSHREALAHLVYGLEQGEGFIVLAGEVGTGKTTLCRSLLERIEADSEIAILFNPSNNDIELLQSISEEFGLVAERRSRRQLLSGLNDFLLDCHRRERRVVLIVDEAQNLSSATLEQIRLLSNLETATSKLIQIIMLGQPELERKLDSDALRQLRQRVTVRWSLHPFSSKDSAAYVNHRLYIAAAADREIFTPAALRQVHRLTGGIPRLINVLCDRALLAGYAEGEHRIDARRLRQAAREVPDAARRLRDATPKRIAWAAAAGLALLAVGGWATLRFGSGLGWGTSSGAGEGLAPVSLARSLDPIASSRVDPPRAAGTAVTVIVELPPSELLGPSPRELDADAFRLPEAEAVATPAALPRLGPGDQAAFLEAVLGARDPEGALDAATRAALDLHGVGSPNAGVSSLAEAVAELRAHGLAVLSLSETHFQVLRDLNYPALVELSAPFGESRVVALVGIDQGEVELAGTGDEAPMRIALDVFEEYWLGSAWVVWNPYLDIPDVIAEGARGAAVLWLQEALSRLGYLDAHIAGVYDISTLRGVARFQGQHAVVPDGVAGPRTQMLIYAALDEFAPPQLEHEDSG
jgi:general secretion pathway protein A